LSKIEVNTVDVQCGSTLTLGSAGKTVQIACGATTVGMGRTGTVNWCTTAKTSPLTVASGNGYFINTTSGSITVTLPASPSAGDIVAFKDYANTWDSNSLVVCRNGSKLAGGCINASLAVEGQAVTLIYVDATQGWKDVNDSTSNVQGASFIAATGGTVTTSGNFKIHTFNSSATFCVSAVGNPSGSTSVDYLIAAGGGGGGGGAGPSSVGSGGGGAGGYRESGGTASGNFCTSPLGSGVAALTVAVQGYPITIGGGGTAGAYGPSAGSPGGDGSNSVFSTFTSAGGGGGGARLNSPANGRPGGSGGGAAYDSPNASGGTGNTPPVSPPQGQDGGAQTGDGSGGGGGATAVGTAGSTPTNGPGGAGGTSSINGTPTQRSGGGGAGATSGATTGGSATGGGGAGGPSSGTATAGTANTGGGGGGASSAANNAGAAGGSGVVIIRYRFQ
jgi:hypothetical protein